MSFSSVPMIFDIPELVFLISNYLTRHDMTQCVATSKAFSRQFEPLLYKHFHVNHSSHHDTTALSRNRHHIRTVDILENDWIYLEVLARGLPSAYPTIFNFSEEDQSTFGKTPSPPPRAITISSTASTAVTMKTTSKVSRSTRKNHGTCTNLRLICIPDFEWIGEIASSHHLFTLVHNNHNLTHLNVPGLMLTIDSLLAESFLDAVSNLKHLKHLTISHQKISTASTLQLLRVCLLHPTLSELQCIFNLEEVPDENNGSDTGNGFGNQGGDDQGNDEETYTAHMSELSEFGAQLTNITREALLARTTHTGTDPTTVKIRTLMLPSVAEGYPSSFLLPLLKSEVLDLERFHIPRLDELYQPELESVIRTYCKGLRYLICPGYVDFSEGGEGNDIETTVVVIRACADQGLITFQGRYFLHERAVDALAQYHSSTLVEIESPKCHLVPSSLQQKILSTREQLKRFWVVSSEGGQVALEFRDVLSSPWTCLGMRELCLTLGRSMSQESSADGTFRALTTGSKETQAMSREFLAEAAEAVYRQIGQLTQLEVLSLGCDMSEEATTDPIEFEWDLTLTNGYLMQFRRLKRLRHLELRTDFWSKMGQREVEWMHETWPRLEQVTFMRVSTDKDDPNEFVRHLPHWAWLKAKRPELRISELLV
ncbi:hypothetical protein BGZ51_004471 [Haplosporangium sp. Z 767]|nr:hypothetical protein BGZ51_004471 [Haplosporangium sp. Z 767]KAF9190234.1 hypothetical protein BGZ50_000341 [Haplosporangium sp. Z 11]